MFLPATFVEMVNSKIPTRDVNHALQNAQHVLAPPFAVLALQDSVLTDSIVLSLFLNFKKLPLQLKVSAEETMLPSSLLDSTLSPTVFHPPKRIASS